MIPGTVSGRAIINRETIHVHDLQDVTKREFPESVGARYWSDGQCFARPCCGRGFQSVSSL